MQKNFPYSVLAITLCLAIVLDPICVAANIENMPKTRLASKMMGGFARPGRPFRGGHGAATGNIQFELSEGVEQVEKAQANKVVVATALPPDRLKELLKRLPAQVNLTQSKDFNIPANPTPPPKPGKVVNIQFPPKDAPPPPKVQVKLPPMAVLRKSPEGSMSNVPQVSVTFSQAMVPVADAESDVLSSNIPLQMTPQPKGKWRWLGTQTLVFTPDGNRLPKATEYKLLVPKGTKSAVGGTLADDVSWKITTPSTTLRSFYPDETHNGMREPHQLDQLMLATFDQVVDAQKVLGSFHVVEAGKTVHSLRLATEKEIEDDKNISAQAKSLPKGTWIAFRATKPFEKKQVIKISVGPGIPSSEGPLMQNLSWNYSFPTYGPLDVRTTNNAYSPQASISIEFTNPLESTKFQPSMVSIKPSVPELKVYANGHYLSVSGSFQANTKYDITIDKSLPDVFGQTLGASKTVQASVGQSNPQLIHPGNSMAVLQPSKKPAFTFLTQNLQQVKVCVYATNGAQDYRKYLTNINEYQQWHEKVDQYKEFQGFKSLSSKVISLPEAKEAFNETSVELNSYLKNGLGNVIVTAEKWPRQKNESQRFAIWLQGTRIGIDSFCDRRTLVTLATKLEDGSPMADVQITSEGKRPLNGKTDKNGISRVPIERSEPPILIARSGDDEAFLPNQPGNWIADDSDDNFANKEDTLRWYSVTDRNLYKPGEKVDVKGWIRKFGAGPKGDLSLVKGLAGTSVEYSIRDGNGNDITKGNAKIDESSGFNFSFEIPKTANLGQAVIDLTATNAAGVQSTSSNCMFKIEEFRRPEFELSVKSSKGSSIIFGEGTSLTATASYFSGGPLPDAPMHWDVQSTQTSYNPPGWDDYVFGKQVSYFHFYDFGYPVAPDMNAASSASFDGKTDSTGKHILDLKVKTMPDPFPASIVAEGTVTDVNRQQWSDKATILLHPADVYVGIRSLKQFYKADEQVKIESIVTDLDGKASTGRSVHMEIVRATTEFENGAYVNKDEKLASTDIQSGSKVSPWNLDLTKGGNLKVSAVVTDASGRKNKSEFSFWREEKQPEAQRKVEQGKILLLADKKKYAPGDTAEIMIQAPFGAAKGVVSIRHNGIASAIPFSMTESAGSVKIPITDDFMPNASVQIDLVGPNCVYASGNLDLSVPVDSRKITLDVTPAQKSIAPGASTTVSFKLKDAKGNGLPNSQVAVAVVDESVLALSSYDWADPLSVFYTNSTPDTSDYHARSFVLLAKPKKDGSDKNLSAAPPPMAPMAQSAMAKGAMMESADAMVGARAGGGGGGASRSFGFAQGSFQIQDESPTMRMKAKPMAGASAMAMDDGAMASTPIAIRTNFNALAYFNPNLVTDSSGNASCEVKVPDSLTRYRIMAVAVNGEKLCGKSSASLTARLPLMVRPSAPRFLNFGDRCELPVVLQNQTDDEMSVDVGLRSDNLKFTSSNGKPVDEAAASAKDGLDLLHNSGGNVLVPPNDRVEIRFPMVTENDGTAALDIAAASGSVADAASITLPVYTPATTHAFATYGQVDEGGANQTVELPKDVYSQIGGLELSTSSTSLQSLTDAYIYLHNYSFACSEQLSARMLATCALQDVLTAFNKMTPAEIQSAKAQVQDDIKELCKRQNDEGGFGLWKRQEEHYWPFVSVQVTRALFEAKKRNYDVSDANLNRAKAYLASIESHMPTKDYDVFTRRSITAYALFVRHLMGDSQPAVARRLVQTALASYDNKENSFRRNYSAPIKGLSQQDTLLQVFSMETLGWLLPVLSSDKSDSAETKLLRTAINAHIKETAALAEITDDSYGEYNYCVFYSSPRMNATMLEALIMDQPKNDVIPKLASSLLAHRRAGKWESTQENCTALLALNRYFNTYEKQVPDFTANTWLGNTYVGANKFVGRTTDTQVINVPMRFLEAHPQDKDFLIAKTGKGRLYYRLALNYAPKNLKLGAYDNGFTLKRTYEPVDNAADVKKDADGVWHVKSGATVKVKIELTLPGHRYHVALTDPLPAGMEPINTALEGGRSMRPDMKQEAGSEDPNTAMDDYSGGSSMYRWNPWWNYNWYEHQNLRDFRAEAFSSSLYSGKYNYSYSMRATTPGDYIVPPTKAEEMYTPETFGRAASERMIIE